MAAAVKTIKIPADIEYRVIGNAMGLLIAGGGLLAGTMMKEGSLEYWPDDIVPLVLVAIMAFRLYRNFVLNMQAPTAAPSSQASPVRRTVTPESVAMGQLPPVPGYTPEQVMEEVTRRIEANKAKSAKKNEPQ